MGLLTSCRRSYVKCFRLRLDMEKLVLLVSFCLFKKIACSTMNIFLQRMGSGLYVVNGGYELDS